MLNCGDFTAVYSLVPLLSTMAGPYNPCGPGELYPESCWPDHEQI